MLKNRILAFALAVITALSLIGCSGTGMSAEVIECIQLGAKYLEDGEYEEAIEAYEDALELDEYAWEAHTGLITAMSKAERPQEEINEKITVAMETSLDKAEEGIENNEVDALVELYETAIEVSEGNDVLIMDILITSNDVLLEENPLHEDYVAKLEEMANYYIAGNNYDAAQELIDRLAEEGKDSLVEELQKALDDKKLAEEAYVEVLKEAAEYIVSEDWQGLADLYASEDVYVLDEKLGDVGYISYAFNDVEHGGNVIAYYSMEGCNCNQWYYGQMKEGVRTGNGGWFWAKNESDGIYVENYVGQWENDAPNGAGYWYIEFGGSVIKDMDVTVANGLLHGSFTESVVDEDGYEWVMEYTIENGKYVEVEVEDWISQEEGKIIYAVAYRDNEDGTRSAVKWTAYEDEVEGIAHFR